jgi:hypothetical protein
MVIRMYDKYLVNYFTHKIQQHRFEYIMRKEMKCPHSLTIILQAPLRLDVLLVLMAVVFN